MFYVYVIYNGNKIYIGHTAKLEERLARHNKRLPNKSKSYTSKNIGDWKLVYEEEFASRKEAMMREKQLKSAQGRKFIWNKIRNI